MRVLAFARTIAKRNTIRRDDENMKNGKTKRNNWEKIKWKKTEREKQET